MLSWETIFSEETPPPETDIILEEKSPKRENLEREFELFKAKGGPERLLNLCRDCILAIPPSTVQPERDFSALRQSLGENRSSGLRSGTLDDTLVLKKSVPS